MNRRLNHIILFAVTLGLICSGCGAEGRTAQAVLNTVSMFGEGDSAGPAYQALLASYRQAKPGTAVEDRSEVSSEQWKHGVLESFQAEETMPDVLFFFTGADVRDLILKGQVVSVEEIRQDYPDYAGNIRASAMEFMRAFDGEHYAVPARGFWEGLFCNTDLFEQYGAPLPNDWASFETAIEVFADNGVVPIAASLKEVPHYWIEHLILSEGGSVEHRLNPKGYVPPSWVDGISWFETLYQRSAFPPDTTAADNASETELFLEKKAAMTLDGSWLVPSIQDQAHTAVLPFPVAPGGKMERGEIISGFSSGFYITRKAWDDPRKRQAAVDFVSYMTSAESIDALCGAGDAPALELPQSGTATTLQTTVDALQKNAPSACMPIDSKLYKEAWQSLCRDIPAVARGECSAREAVERLAEANQW